MQTELVRQPQQRFVYLQNALKELVAKKAIKRFSIFTPIEQTQMIKHSGDLCWSFLDEDSQRRGMWPMRGWRLIVPSKIMDDGSIKRGQPRVALVVEIEYKDIIGYWIEIECRGADLGV